MSRAWQDLMHTLQCDSLYSYRLLFQEYQEIDFGKVGGCGGPGNHHLRVALKDMAPLTLMLGVTGCGKSKGLICLLHQFILLRQPFTLIDPTGSILRELVPFLAELLFFAELNAKHAANRFERQFYGSWVDYLRRHFVVLDFSGEFRKVQHCFNPLYCHPARPHEGPEFVVSCLLRSCARQFGSMDQMRRLKNVLEASATIAAEEGQNLLRIPELIQMNSDEFEKVVNRLYELARQRGLRCPRSDYQIRVMNDLVMSTSGKERRDLVQSTLNLLNVFLTKEKVRSFVNCRGDEPNALDFHTILNGEVNLNSEPNFLFGEAYSNGEANVFHGGTNFKGQSDCSRQSHGIAHPGVGESSVGGLGKTMLVHLPNSDLDFVKVMGNLLITRIEQQARLRTPAHRKKRYFLVVDEMALTVDQGTAEAASIIRQLGLRMILAGQSSMQPPFGTSEEGRAIFHTLVSQAWMKIFYRLDVEDARRFAPYIYLANGEMERKEYVEETTTSAESFGEQATVKTGVEFQHGTDVSRGAENSLQGSLGLSAKGSVSEEERKGKELSFAKTFEEHQSHTNTTEHRDFDGFETSHHISLSAGFARERSNSQTSSQTSASSNTSLQQGIHDDEGYSTRAVQNRERRHDQNVTTTMGENNKYLETQTDSRSTAQKSGHEFAQANSFSQGTRQGVEERAGETYQVAQVNVLGHQVERNLSLSQTQQSSVTQKQGMAFRKGKDFGHSQQLSQGLHRREVKGFHTLEQTHEIVSHWLQTQPDRQCFVTQKPQTQFVEGELAEGELWVCQMQTHTIGDDFVESCFQTNLVESFLNTIAQNHLPTSSKEVFEVLDEDEEVESQDNVRALPEGLDL